LAVKVFQHHAGVMLMDYGLAGYLMFVAAVALMLHLLSRRFFVVRLGAAVLCPVAALWYSAWARNFNVNVAWAPVVLVWLALYALPVGLVVGLPFVIMRRSLRPTHRTVKTSLIDER
jgi:hypothetical protein